MSEHPADAAGDVKQVEEKEVLEFADLPHRFHQFENPKHGPHFDKDDCRWPSIVGHFFRVIVQDPAIKGFVFLNHGDADIELRFASVEFGRIEKNMVTLASSLGIKWKTHPTEGQTIGKHAYRGKRWVSDGKGEAAEAQRSEMVFKFLHAGCALYIDNLVWEEPYWKFERNPEQQENPLGNSFESLLHLISNFSQAQFDVYFFQTGTNSISAATAWMPRPIPLGSVRCKL